MMKIVQVIVAATIFVIAAQVVAADQCAGATNCATCVAINLCGWCSVPVTYNNGSNGPQCAGFSPNGSTPFVCNGVYSTNICQAGYICNEATGSCSLGQPGTGLPLAQCQAECKKSNISVYLCDKSTKQCNSVPPGTPGSSSLQICEAICSGSPTPSPGPVQATYACNTSTWQCAPTTPGHGSSLLVCQQLCNASNVQYICNPTTATCDQVPPLTPGGMPLAQCQLACSNMTAAPIPPNPGPPPEYIGIWRGVEIQNGYSTLEYDILINNTIATFTIMTQTNTTSFSGVPYHIPNSPDLEMWVEINTGIYAGLTIRSIGDTSGANGPQTSFATMALAPPGKATPASLTSAMTDGTSTVLALTKCIIDNPYCIFTMPSGGGNKKSLLAESTNEHAARRAESIQAMNVILRQKREEKLAAEKKEKQIKVRSNATANDKCMQYDEACSVCLSHQYCGWCSVPVTYSDGSKGTQCAGFQGDTPFVCPGHYSTSSCEVGYICTSGTFQCIPSQPGDGMPQSVCLATCKPTPPPAPRPTEYTCNLTTTKCDLCASGQCPGSMPLNQCESLCPHPYPGPTPDMIGIWRGIYVQQQYSNGELDFVLEPSGATVYKDGQFYYHATIISLGADVMIFTIDKGANKGSTFGTLYQMAKQDFGMYWQMTMAIGGLNQDYPADYNTPMYQHGLQEVVLASCLKAPCTFVNP